jgi:hypothetical protein
MNIVGFFRENEECDLYQVDIWKDNTTPIEIEMAGNSPVIVTYEESNTPFEPVRKSTASLTFVADDLADCVSETADGTKVKITSDGEVKWCGYLKPYIQSQSFRRCVDNIELEASDAVSLLQYIKYTPVGSYRNIVTFKQLLKKICDSSELLKGFAWPITKKYGLHQVVPSDLKMSEQNFYSSDTDEPWTLFEVLEEMSRYLGLTAMQIGEYLYLVDYGAMKVQNPSYQLYHKADDYATPTTATTSYSTVEQKDIRGDGSNINFEQIYTKVSVKDSFYKPEYYTPDFWKEDYITNVYNPDQPWTCKENEYVLFMGIAMLPYISAKGKFEYEAADYPYQYFNRRYTNKYYEGIYYNSDLTPYTPSDMTHSALTRDYIGGTLVETATIERGLSGWTNYEEAGSINFTKAICISQMDQPAYYSNPNPYLNDYLPVMKVIDNYTNPIIHNGSNTYIVIDGKAFYERHRHADYINPKWVNEEVGASRTTTSSAGNRRPSLCFRLGINGNYWNGTQWQSTPCNFLVDAVTGLVDAENDEKPIFMEGSNWNLDRNILNNIAWVDWVGLNGYKIPLDSAHNFNGPIDFQINLPTKLASYHGPHEDECTLNSYCYLKDFSVKIANKGSENTKNDLVIQNVIEGPMENEMNEITCRFTTYDIKGGLSYSNVGYGAGLCTDLTDVAIGVEQKPEENLIQRLVNQYSTPTVKLGLELTLDYNPLDKITDIALDEYEGKTFGILGQTIDYKAGSQEITLIELK